MTLMVNDPRVSNRQISEVRFVYRRETGRVNGKSSWSYTDVDWWEGRAPVELYDDVPNIGDAIVMPGHGGTVTRCRGWGEHTEEWEEHIPSQVPCRIIDHIWMPNNDTLTWTLFVLLGAQDEQARSWPPIPSSKPRGTILPDTY